MIDARERKLNVPSIKDYRRKKVYEEKLFIKFQDMRTLTFA